MERPVAPAGGDPGEGSARGGVVAAVEPKLPAVGKLPGERPVGQALQAPRPIGAHEARTVRRLVQPEPVQVRGAGERDAGVLDLMGAGQRGQRIDAPRAVVFEDQLIVLGPGAPVRAEAEERRAHLGGARLDDGERCFRLRPDDRGHPGFQDARLLERDFLQRVPQELHVIDGDGRDHGELGPRDQVGGVEPPAQTRLQQQHVRRFARERQERRGGGDLEEGDGRLAVRRFARLQKFNQVGFADRAAGQADAFVKAHQVGRGVGLHRGARRTQHGAQEGDHRALAVGPGDVDDRGQVRLRMAEAREQPLDAAERKVDQLGVQPGQAVEDRVTPRARRRTDRCFDLCHGGIRFRFEAGKPPRRAASFRAGA